MVEERFENIILEGKIIERTKRGIIRKWFFKAFPFGLSLAMPMISLSAMVASSASGIGSSRSATLSTSCTSGLLLVFLFLLSALSCLSGSGYPL